jgi:pimeloyl-ACP methyl ester carboxylesterase
MDGFEPAWTLGNPRLRVMRRRGAGKRLLLFHGVLRCGDDFSSVLPDLDPEWDLTLIDQRGHGGSDHANTYRVLDYIRDAVRFVQELASPDLFIYGHSLGAMVAAGVAEHLPVAGIILEDPPFDTMGKRIPGSHWQELFMGFERVARAGGNVDQRLEGLKAVGVRNKDGVVVPLAKLRDEASLRWSAECLGALDPAVLAPLLEGSWLEGWNWEGVLARGKAKTLLLQGDVAAGGALLNEDVHRAGSDAIGVRRLFFPGCGHQLHWTDPKGIAGLVNAFCSQA